MNVRDMKDTTLTALFTALSEEFVDVSARYKELRETCHTLYAECDKRGLFKALEETDGDGERAHEEDDHDGDQGDKPSVPGQLGADLREQDYTEDPGLDDDGLDDDGNPYPDAP